MLKRDVVKYIRDKAKSGYTLDKECEICGTKYDRELHHYNSISELVAKYLQFTEVKPEDVLDWRDDFIDKYSFELYDCTATLCNKHHKLLHTIYGQHPGLHTVNMQRKWVASRRNKCLNG